MALNYSEIQSLANKFIINKNAYSNSINILKSNIGEILDKYYEKISVLDNKAYRLWQKKAKESVNFIDFYKNIGLGENIPKIEPIILFLNHIDKIFNSKYAIYQNTLVRMQYKMNLNEEMNNLSNNLDKIKL
jgi:hypothetical protein